MSPRMEVGGVDLHYEVRGPADAPPVVLLHGFPLDHTTWAPQVEALEARWQLVTPDLRGLGASGVGDGQYAVDFWVDDLFALLDGLGTGPAVGCGLSMGGYVLLRALERDPARFTAAVLADTRSAPDDDAGRLARVAAVRALKRKGPAVYARQFAEQVLGRGTLAKRPEVVARVRDLVARQEVIGMAGAQLAMAARTDTTHVLQDLAVPLLVIVGEEDTLTPRETAGAMAEAAPDARLAVIPDAGHLSNLENPEEFNRVLERFLDEVAGGDREGRAAPP